MKLLKVLAIPLAAALVAGGLAHVAAEKYILLKAEQNIKDVLLSHRGVHQYIQRTMHPEFYEARGDGLIAPAYYAPEIFSSSFMVRVIHGYYNAEREKSGLPRLYYKMAADNPRNPVNAADERELALLEYFRKNPDVTEYSAVEKIDGSTYLVYAMPFLKTEERCLVCHGDREDAPMGLQEKYPGQGGFGDKAGNLRAIESLRAPIAFDLDVIWGVTLAALAAIGSAAALFVFNRFLGKKVDESTTAFEERELRIQRLLDSNKGIPYEYSLADGRFSYLGGQVGPLLGYGAEEIQTWRDWVTKVNPGDRAFVENLNKIERQRESFLEVRYRLTARDGRIVKISDRSNPVYENGVLTRIVGFWTDITRECVYNDLSEVRLKLAEWYLSHNLDELMQRTVDEAENLTDSRIGFFHFLGDDQETIELKAWSTRTQRDMCSAHGKGDHYPVSHAGVWADAVRLSKPVIHNDYERMEGKKGLPPGHARVIREAVVPIYRNDRIVAVMGVGNKESPYHEADLEIIDAVASTAIQLILLKSAEEQRKKLEAQLSASQRLESLGVLAGGIAHDFNNILTAIIGYTELASMEARNANPSEAESSLDEVLKASLRAKDLVRQILTFAKRSNPEQKPVNLLDSVKEALRLIRATVPSAIEIEFESEMAPGECVMADPVSIHQVAMNLCTNAVLSMKENGSGRLRVSLKTLGLSEEEAAKLKLPLSGRVGVFSVSDTGCGMSEEVLGRIFEPFFTTRKGMEGTGMGLAVVHGVVEESGGAIRVASTVGSGSVFTVYLPLMEKVEEDAKPASAKAAQGSERILFLDDEVQSCQLMAKALGRQGFKVSTFTTPFLALEAFSRDPSAFDLVVTDVTMPGMGGDQFTEKIKRIRRNIPVIMCTGFSERVDDERAKEAGASILMMKPVHPLELAAKIRSIIDRESSGG